MRHMTAEESRELARLKNEFQDITISPGDWLIKICLMMEPPKAIAFMTDVIESVKRNLI